MSEVQRPRLCSFVHQNRHSYGAIVDGGIVDLGALHGAQWATLDAAVADGALAQIAESAATRTADFALDDISFDIPITNPGKIICVGVNYPDRNAEYKDGQELPPYPSIFIRFPESFVGHDQAVVRPPESEKLDYEGELVLVIGREGRRIPEDSALDHVAAVTLCNEGTIRDWVRHAKFNVTQGKNFDRTGAIGPWLVPFEDESQIADIELTTRVNGEVRQNDRTARMMFGFKYLISYISTFTTLKPGDVIVTGTPTGAGARLDPPVWLKPGDVVEVEAEGVGVLSNRVEDEQ
ncbi:5-carboxymethyl-2-hydroxymuconate isomerase protein [Salinisphaera shabanensis E1L3A]|uniref:5-carboxymethyl-2-hydroxymuconate isomerase protein n=1 Tax=Salinisphaera shabanensis E1L3A TaxID=1033802 RepID=U2FR56_9GAMM|nr:fumarylacetoacetate hydrolase family protein [Salinisphaera shabanensis]ERJ18549.1 5-carboxymethyl-2-hydroxymuconate isomerase protein [Salinisphaera shabanensis E1L3A]